LKLELNLIISSTKTGTTLQYGKKIASIMCANGYIVAQSDANDKFRNLMATYRYGNIFIQLLGIGFNSSFLN